MPDQTMGTDKSMSQRIGLFLGAAFFLTVVLCIYLNSTIFFFVGGSTIVLTMARWNLHKRNALFIGRVIGGGPSRIVLEISKC